MDSIAQKAASDKRISVQPFTVVIYSSKMSVSLGLSEAVKNLVSMKFRLS